MFSQPACIFRKHISMKKLLLLTLLLSSTIAIIFLTWSNDENFKLEQITFSQNTQILEPASTEQNFETKESNRHSSIQKTITSDNQTTINKQTPCITKENYFEIEEFTKLSDWYSSWGAPTFYVDLNGRIYFEEHIYQYVDNEFLEGLAASGDMHANYALGLIYIWEGLTGNKSPSLTSQLQDWREITLLDEPDKEKLNQGRMYLFESIAAGNIYAYTELARSYAFEKLITLSTLSEEQLEEVDGKIALYTKMPQYLINELNSSNFSISSPDLHKKGALEILTPLLEQETIRMINYRQRNDNQPLSIRPKSDFFEEPVFCKE